MGVLWTVFRGSPLDSVPWESFGQQRNPWDQDIPYRGTPGHFGTVFESSTTVRFRLSSFEKSPISGYLCTYGHINGACALDA